MSLLEVKDLATHFRTENGVVEAVKGSSFTLDKGETLAQQQGGLAWHRSGAGGVFRAA